MSSLLYGIVTAKRIVAPAKQSQTTATPGIGTYIDTLAALVPAEALALYWVVIIPYSTHAVSLHGKKVAVISDPTLLAWSCAGLLALSSLLYIVGRKKLNLTAWDALRFLLPPIAFAAWMLVQTPGVWDIWWPGSGTGDRAVVAVFAAVVLGIAAKALGNQADAMTGAPAVTKVDPTAGPVAGGTRVTVTGSGFTGATAVNFGRARAPDLVIADDAELTVTSPGGGAGTVQVAVNTRAGTSPASPGGRFSFEPDAALAWPLERAGSTGENVRTIQYLLRAAGYHTAVDGDFGPLTKESVDAFQSSRGMDADGIVGQQTCASLIIRVQPGSNGDAVRAVQSQLHRRGDGAQIIIDGIFGPVTQEAIRAFQSLLGRTADGIVGQPTWNHLVRGYLTAPDAQSAARDVFSAWMAHRRDQAAKNATPAAVSEIFTQTYSPADGWRLDSYQGAAGHTFGVWKRSTGHELRIGVQNAVEGPYYVADQAQFT